MHAQHGIAIRGRTLVSFEVLPDGRVRFEPLSAGRRYQVKAARNVALRDCWSYYRVVESA